MPAIPSSGDIVHTRDGHPARVVAVHYEDGVAFAWIEYLNGHLPYAVGGRVAGTEEAPIWEHRVFDGKVVRSGGDYWNPNDWVVERGLRLDADDAPVAPKFHRVAAGDYETADGQFRIWRLLDVNPPAWNVEYGADADLIVDGAATMRDAVELFADWYADARERGVI